MSRRKGRKRGDLYRVTKSHGGEVHLTDVAVPTISDRRNRTRTLIVREGQSVLCVILHPRAIRKLARDTAAMVRRLPRRK